jgi:transcriptional regulator with XRE-family HTH domain
MTSVPIKELRKSLGMSLTDFAAVLGLTGANAADTIRHLENGKQQPSGPITRVLSYLAQAVDIDATTQTLATPARLLPKWALCRGLEPQGRVVEYLMHNEWPRFYGVVASRLTPSELDLLVVAKIPVLPLDVELGLGHLVVLFIDPPAVDTSAVLNEAVRLTESQARATQSK